MKPPKKLSLAKVASSYRKGVKKEKIATHISNYQTGTSPKMDRLVDSRMGKHIAAGTSFTGPVYKIKTTVKNTSKPTKMTYGSQSKSKGGFKGATKTKRGRA